MWYRVASKQEDEEAPFSPEELTARAAVRFWDRHGDDRMPNRHNEFAKSATEALLAAVAGEPYLAKEATGGAFDNRRQQLHAYATLLFRELAWRYASLFSDVRAESKGEEARAEVLKTVHDEVTQAAKDLLATVKTPNA